jgi:uncharacterized repeat protein (TIGR03803 family)
VAIAAILATLLAPSNLAAQSAPRQGFHIFHTFTGADGVNPVGLTRDVAGNLYGTTISGGAYDNGTIFKLDTSGAETVLYSFTGGADGAQPRSGVIRDPDGNLYGTAYWGGYFENFGTVFKLDTSGTLTVLHTFTDEGDGTNPLSGLLRDAEGNLYGTTPYGRYTSGIVFKVDPTGAFTTLYDFDNSALAQPGNLIRDTAGNLYGTTVLGGAQYAGTVFKLDPTGTLTDLYTFTGGVDGEFPRALIRDSAGNFYGTTYQGGVYGRGVVYKLDTQNVFTVLYTFTGGTDGAGPSDSGLIRDRAGNLYGTTEDVGVVFKLAPDGTETVLYRFRGGPDGEQPGSLITDGRGNLVGAALGNPAFNDGVVFKVKP